MVILIVNYIKKIGDLLTKKKLNLQQEFDEEIDYYREFLDDKNVEAKVKRMCNSDFCNWKLVIENPYF